MSMENDRLFGQAITSAYEQRIKRKDEQHTSSIIRPRRKNNRKNTKSRKTQYITEHIAGTFPPKFKTKCIKHESK